jgi:hypothetical protein
VYRFVTIKGSCCEDAYDIGRCEESANKMEKNGFELVQVYQTSTSGCVGSKSMLVMVFKSKH